MSEQNCYHCGTQIIKAEEIIFDQKHFCCSGCKTVYEIFSENNLTSYYELEKAPGATPTNQQKFDFLDNDQIVEKLLSFNEGDQAIVNLNIPHIHCSSCIWILENLNKLDAGVVKSQVNFHDKKVQIYFSKQKTSLKQIVQLLAKIGYEPYISLENYDTKTRQVDRSLIYKVGVAFFSFGNVMLLSFPEYFEVNEFWIDQYKDFFRWLIFIIAMPSFLYSGWGYYEAAYKSIKNGRLNIEVPMALGLIVMFLRSTYDIVFDQGQGFFDSLCSLIFFMLLGKLFQQKTYSFLSFERDYKSYFPIAVTKLLGKEEVPTQIYELKKGDRILIRNQELVPVDGILISPLAAIDYSFVTGEENPVEKFSGDKIFAGGKLVGSTLELEVINEVSQSYLTQLWSNEAFEKDNATYQTLINKVSQYFTPALLILAVLAFVYWSFINMNTAFNVFTAILIVACPCALALSTPFTMGNVLRILGKHKFYLKNAQVVEQIAQINTIVFDKTGTITSNQDTKITYHGTALSDQELIAVKSTVRSSNHPLSRKLYNFLNGIEVLKLSDFNEVVGGGVIGSLNKQTIYVGSAKFVEQQNPATVNKTVIYIKIDQEIKGYYEFTNIYRNGVSDLFNTLQQNYKLAILSGDNDGERAALERILPQNTTMLFNQSPNDKLEYIANLQKQHKQVMMVGDGLNDSGALAKSNVGIAISENINVFSPACDAILDASVFSKISKYLLFCKKAISTIKVSFGLSLTYNVIGLTFACMGLLSPLVAAIIMPVSTVTIIGFVTLATNYKAYKLKL
ncbi:heavy metal translocating P-type ATPase metal-binding domain-containing protein [Flavobacterium agricola]|uniref:Heavy metal translocating P-type ATPase metal-binding domain-containing protein n=1 Tax=Flavobacterium agricola TaxID=2870839 RepID=A0ABY6M4R5_9FLAO|nr:heavy metal translocating P-type ATPase metal-binding domain-containing protein [Flavobacterium agricola]UYW02421.1 heavy metal translocating P-type ATPase metal-binding domain-containing protein [Flavobacterium agricola]